MVKTIIDKYTGKVLYCRVDEPTEENEIAIEELLTEEMENPYFDFENQVFYDKI
jgi:hypothetical protein